MLSADNKINLFFSTNFQESYKIEVETSTRSGGFMVCVCIFMTGAPEGSTESSFYGETGNRICDPWFTRHRLIPSTTAASLNFH